MPNKLVMGVIMFSRRHVADYVMVPKSSSLLQATQFYDEIYDDASFVGGVPRNLIKPITLVASSSVDYVKSPKSAPLSRPLNFMMDFMMMHRLWVVDQATS